MQMWNPLKCIISMSRIFFNSSRLFTISYLCFFSVSVSFNIFFIGLFHSFLISVALLLFDISFFASFFITFFDSFLSRYLSIFSLSVSFLCQPLCFFSVFVSLLLLFYGVAFTLQRKIRVNLKKRVLSNNWDLRLSQY